MTLAVVKTIEATSKRLLQNTIKVFGNHMAEEFPVNCCNCYDGEHSGDTQLGGRF